MIDVKCFGVAKEIVGDVNLILEYDKLAVSELRRHLESMYPEFQKINSYMIAVNQSYSEDEQFITNNDEVAIIPPVSGG